jgi:hypothetical protein
VCQLIMRFSLFSILFQKQINKVLKMCFEQQCHLLLCGGYFWHIVTRFGSCYAKLNDVASYLCKIVGHIMVTLCYNASPSRG